MGYENILYEAKEGVATIAIKCPPHIVGAFGAVLLSFHGL